MTTKKSSPAWWRAFGWRPGHRGHGHSGMDFADMGTVFGLEASLGASADGLAVENRSASSDSADAPQRSAIERLNGRSVI